jgi:hypothetical protein
VVKKCCECKALKKGIFSPIKTVWKWPEKPWFCGNNSASFGAENVTVCTAFMMAAPSGEGPSANNPEGTSTLIISAPVSFRK